MSFRQPSFAAWNQRILAPLFTEGTSSRKSSYHPRGISPLTIGILPGNLSSLGQNRGIAVELWNRWPELLAGLPSAGEVLVITCSECAVLGKYLTYPALHVNPANALACDSEGEFDLAFAAWRQARALHMHTTYGHQYGVEIRGWSGETLHKICLQADSHLDAFLEWVQIHQAVGPNFEPVRKPILSEDQADLMADSIHTKDHLFVEPARLSDWLRGTVDYRLPIRALVGNDGVVQGHCFVPRSLRQQGPWLFASSDEVGLHLDPAKIDRVVLHNIAPDGPVCWTIKAYGPSGQLSLALAPTTPGHRPEWTALTGEVFPEIQDR